MDSRKRTTFRRFVPWTAAALSVVLVGACGDAEMDEVPEVAEVEAELDEGELELDEELVLGPDDVGETLMATGWVIGLPLENGFYLRTEGDRVIFVETTEPVMTGDVVRVWGPLAATQVAVFDEWETDAFETGFEAEWDIETAYYISATDVEPDTMPMEQPTSPADTGAVADTTVGGDTVSGRG